MLRRTVLCGLAIFALIALLIAPTRALAGTGVAPVPQGTQSDAAYARSFAKAKVTNTTATTQRTSCYTPEVPYFTSDGPNDGYTGMTTCPGATTDEALGPYPTQAGSN